MVPNSVSADEEPLRNAWNAVPGPDVEQDFSLARRELLEIRVIGSDRPRREGAGGDPEELEFPRDPVDRSAEMAARDADGSILFVNNCGRGSLCFYCLLAP